MRKVTTVVLVVALLAWAMVAQAGDKTFETALSQSVAARTTVRLINGMQVALVEIVIQGQPMGELTLSPVQPVASNLVYRQGETSVHISRANFQAAFGLEEGRVALTGMVDDPEGGGDAPFEMQVATWSNDRY